MRGEAWDEVHAVHPSVLAGTRRQVVEEMTKTDLEPDVESPVAAPGVRFTKTATGGSCTLTCHGKDHQGSGTATAEQGGG